MLQDINNSLLSKLFESFALEALQKINEGYHVFYKGDGI
jgi:hypothetical protein